MVGHSISYTHGQASLLKPSSIQIDAVRRLLSGMSSWMVELMAAPADADRVWGTWRSTSIGHTPAGIIIVVVSKCHGVSGSEIFSWFLRSYPFLSALAVSRKYGELIMAMTVA
ncbi:hypothetical protein ASPNIDRAFT_42884 [Aspergillus niger ATCC 1015]|uniref:Uncharacterized protein n=1 Tax=Aspergillus niger (strain ATCC 1015 / CBS 113.46 / FGSC A1144 / LSHB Ac4 / NCTC 3858a / NRRL 328 / USDA 3528.7) TaxID=380704 RepID=G3YE61_ASPNA|nr:uncharacterized protein BO96DRAFT_350810 [Aspergillus niger CBS 101883]EHA19073.1 hypothetical protein ASPNIDRAFT_42884 [Aspergillus niger ATCC 1015]PYH51151.1 hypothetical protein BO96DRAFT_350810 [Aspergillus niger CBS 101883]